MTNALAGNLVILVWRLRRHRRQPALHPHPDDEGMGAAGGGILQARLRGRGQGQLRHLRGVRGAGAEPAEPPRPARLHPAAQVLQRPVRRAAARLLAGGRHLAEIVHFGDQQVFHAATTYTCLLFLDRAGRDEFRFERVADRPPGARRGKWTPKVSQTLRVSPRPIPADRATAAEWNFTVGAGAGLFEKLRAMPVKLGDVAARMAQGIQTSADEVYVLDAVRMKAMRSRSHSKH